MTPLHPGQSTYMQGRGCRGAYLTFELHDGRKLFAGTTLKGWWVSIYTGKDCTESGRGGTLYDAVRAAEDELADEVLQEIFC